MNVGEFDDLYLVAYCDTGFKPYKDLTRLGETDMVAPVDNYSCARSGGATYKNLIPVPAGGSYMDQFTLDYTSIFYLEDQELTDLYPSIRTTKQTVDLQLKYLVIKEVRHRGRLLVQAEFPEDVRVSNAFDVEIIANW